MPHFRQGIKNIPEICFQHNVRKVVISPGSRNAPLIFAFTAHTEIECISITDERSAAYFALGLAQESGEAVALVCTSGTAVLNYAPAIAEAYYQNLPLLVITADRPAEMIDQADGQTLRQFNIFENYIKSCFELPVDTTNATDLDFSDRQMSQAIETAINYPQGPVQINVPFREPIYTALPEKHSQPKIIKTLTSEQSLTGASLEKLNSDWHKYKKKLVVFGVFSKNNELTELANKLANEPDVVVLCENLSNISGDKIITQPESLFSRINSKTDKELFKPELLITIGHSVICKQLKIFLRENQPIEHWQIESSLPYVDTYKSLTTVIPGKAINIFEKLAFSKQESDFSEIYKQEIEQVNLRHQKFVQSKTVDINELSDLNITVRLLEQLKPTTVLHLANSTSVRWTQLFKARTDLTYICNRGTSGIDGSMSTAVGYAHASDKDIVFLTGDLSFIYDSNALWNNYISKKLKIVVMNNNGGNIFRFIGDKELMSNSLEYFITPHNVKIKSLVEAFGLNYTSCVNAADLQENLTNLLNAPTATVLEIFTEADINTENYKGYFKNIKGE